MWEPLLGRWLCLTAGVSSSVPRFDSLSWLNHVTGTQPPRLIMGPNLLLGAMAGHQGSRSGCNSCAWSMRIPRKVKQGCSCLANVGQIVQDYCVLYIFILYILLYAYFLGWLLPSNWIQLEPGQWPRFEVGSVMNFSLPSWLILICWSPSWCIRPTRPLRRPWGSCILQM